MISVVITTYNRCDIVGQAIRSAISFAGVAGGKVIVVDDASTDDTQTIVHRDFTGELASGLLNYHRFEMNRGVTAAKNAGFAAAQSSWVIFLDSDDELLPQTAQSVKDTLMAYPKAPVVFFRCVDETGNFVGRHFAEPQEISFARFIAHTSHGEALVAINKMLNAQPPFDADLRGYEGLGCARLIKQNGPALLSNIVARRYNRSRADRLSRSSGFLPRARLLAIGHLRYISVGGSQMSVTQQIALRAKAAIYSVMGILYGIFWTRHE